MTPCESTRGKWSTPTKTNYCPACKAPMPVDRGPLSAPGWRGQNHMWSRVSNRADGKGNPVMARAPRMRMFSIKRRAA